MKSRYLPVFCQVATVLVVIMPILQVISATQNQLGQAEPRSYSNSYEAITPKSTGKSTENREKILGDETLALGYATKFHYGHHGSLGGYGLFGGWDPYYGLHAGFKYSLYNPLYQYYKQYFGPKGYFGFPHHHHHHGHHGGGWYPGYGFHGGGYGFH